MVTAQMWKVFSNKIRHIASFEALLVSLEALPVPIDAQAAMSVAIAAPLGQKPCWIVCEE